MIVTNVRRLNDFSTSKSDFDLTQGFTFFLPGTPIDSSPREDFPPPRKTKTPTVPRFPHHRPISSMSLFDRQERVFTAASALYVARQKKHSGIVAEGQTRLSQNETNRFMNQCSRLNPLPFLRDEQILEEVAASRFGIEVEMIQTRNN
jgi:hypothetical protein